MAYRYIGNVRTDVDPQAITDDLVSRGIRNVKVEENMRTERSKSFKVSFNRDDAEKADDASFWPANVIYRKWHTPRPKRNNERVGDVSSVGGVGGVRSAGGADPVDSSDGFGGSSGVGGASGVGGIGGNGAVGDVSGEPSVGSVGDGSSNGGGGGGSIQDPPLTTD